ncbi:MAG: hypothetical protein ACXWPM_13290 [Bdellovibrionota bacterium]
MTRITVSFFASTVFLWAQTQPQRATETPQASFGLQDATIIQRLAQTKPALGKGGPVPRLADGKPDLSGPWEPNAIRENVSLVATGIQIPFRPEAKAIYDQRLGTLGKDDPEARCLPPGVPRLTTTPYPFRFLQVPGLIVIIYEGGSQTFRQIFVDGRKHSKFAEDLWNGESVGHWEDDTLVVETVGFNEKTWIDAAGVPHSKDMKVTERIRRLDADNMEIVSTVDDARMYTKPWSFTTYPKRLAGEILEYICNENEVDARHLVGK